MMAARSSEDAQLPSPGKIVVHKNVNEEKCLKSR